MGWGGEEEGSNIGQKTKTLRILGKHARHAIPTKRKKNKMFRSAFRRSIITKNNVRRVYN